MEEQNRTLTDKDIAALAEALRNEMMKQFYQDLGQGVLGWLYKLAMGAILTLAAYGAARTGGIIK